jgi:hypothetical protein
VATGISASRDVEIPRLPGLYRIRCIGRDDLNYIGQTSMGTMTLRKRLGRLRGINGEVMPYRDLHTAGPAHYHQTGREQEVARSCPLGTSGKARNGAK